MTTPGESVEWDNDTAEKGQHSHWHSVPTGVIFYQLLFPCYLHTFSAWQGKKVTEILSRKKKSHRVKTIMLASEAHLLPSLLLSPFFFPPSFRFHNLLAPITSPRSPSRGKFAMPQVSQRSPTFKQVVSVLESIGWRDLTKPSRWKSRSCCCSPSRWEHGVKSRCLLWLQGTRCARCGQLWVENEWELVVEVMSPSTSVLGSKEWELITDFKARWDH